MSRDPSSRTRVLLTGGTGGAKLVLGFHEETAPEDLVVVCNTADDSVVHGLHVSPDVDTIVYTLAGLIDPAKGWGVRDDTFTVLDQLQRLGNETWFRLGDRDIATHLTRTRLLSEGKPLSQVTAALCRALGVRSRVLPMTDQRVETRLATPDGEISFQEYFVKARWQPEVLSLCYRGIEESRPAPGMLEAIGDAASVVVCPSNPATSIGPILAVPGVRQALRDTPARVVAVSPMVQGRSFSGPAHKLMATLGVEASVTGLAEAYRDFVDVLVIDTEDRHLRPAVERLGVEVRTTSIRMDTLEDKKRLARELLTTTP
ncbi:MAG: 2-phospho-L-lactate transferase [Deltaproteobacteria bacterium]|nr:2-phospho-L-lactate transferase [Deltaproteobacteria bacterium]